MRTEARLVRLLCLLAITATCALAGAQGCAGILGLDTDRAMASAIDAPDSGTEAGDTSDAGSDAIAEIEAGPWDCLGEAPPTLDPQTNVDVTLLVLDALRPYASAGANGGSDLDMLVDTPLPATKARPCNVLDPACAQPMASDVATDDAGLAQFALAQSFQGFFELTRSDLLPSTLYIGHLLAGSHEAKLPVALLSTQGAQAITSALGVAASYGPDAGVGFAFVTVFDCHDRHAPGVALSLSNTDSSTVLFYTKDGFPTTTATETDSLGAAGAVNVPVGGLTVTTTLAATATPLAAVNVVIRPGAATFVWIRTRWR